MKLSEETQNTLVAVLFLGIVVIVLAIFGVF